MIEAGGAERMTATLYTPTGEFVQVADYASSLGAMEELAQRLYCDGEKTPRYLGSIVVAVVRDSHAEQLPPWQHIGD